jgi:hypothetical protein
MDEPSSSLLLFWSKRWRSPSSSSVTSNASILREWFSHYCPSVTFPGVFSSDFNLQTR